jgi:hypothetical protein
MGHPPRGSTTSGLCEIRVLCRLDDALGEIGLDFRELLRR